MPGPLNRRLAEMRAEKEAKRGAGDRRLQRTVVSAIQTSLCRSSSVK